MKDSYKYFEFDLSKFIGYRLILEKSNFKHYLKIEYKGFESLSRSNSTFKFKIEKQLIRRLKLKHLNNELKIRSLEYQIWELINKSTEIPSYNSPLYYFTYDFCCSEGTYGKSTEERNEYKNRNKYDNRKFNQKLKSYESKSRFRK